MAVIVVTPLRALHVLAHGHGVVPLFICRRHTFAVTRTRMRRRRAARQRVLTELALRELGRFRALRDGQEQRENEDRFRHRFPIFGNFLCTRRSTAAFTLDDP